MFQHGGTQPWLSSTICCNTLSNLLSFLRTLNKGSKKFSSFIDTINSTTVSNTGPDENRLSWAARGKRVCRDVSGFPGAGTMTGQRVVGPLKGVEGCHDLPVTKGPESSFYTKFPCALWRWRIMHFIWQLGNLSNIMCFLLLILRSQMGILQLYRMKTLKNNSQLAYSRSNWWAEKDSFYSVEWLDKSDSLY